jgi:ferrous iron transport protein A
MKTLDKLKPGETGTINGLKNSELTLKLLEMGLLPGKLIRLSFVAPFGDPIAVELPDYSLSLRLDEARYVEIS